MSEETYYDEDTLDKVIKALWKSGLNTSQTNDALNEMQNAGILFRERRPAIPKVRTSIPVSKEDLEDKPSIYARLISRKIVPKEELYYDTPRGAKMVNPEESPILRYFDYLHLPECLQETSKHFCDLAYYIEDHVRTGPEKSVALRKLLEAKDAAVRAQL